VCEFIPPSLELYESFPILIPFVLGVDGNMRYYVAHNCCNDSAALSNRQDVFCAMSRYRPVPKKKGARGEERFEKRIVNYKWWSLSITTSFRIGGFT